MVWCLSVRSRFLGLDEDLFTYVEPTCWTEGCGGVGRKLCVEYGMRAARAPRELPVHNENRLGLGRFVTQGLEGWRVIFI